MDDIVPHGQDVAIMLSNLGSGAVRPKAYRSPVQLTVQFSDESETRRLVGIED
jgi:hypothetical protein